MSKRHWHQPIENEKENLNTMATNPTPVPEPTTNPTPNSEPAPTPAPAPSPDPVAAVTTDLASDAQYLSQLASEARTEYQSLAPELQGRIHQLLNDIETGAATELPKLHTLFGVWNK